MSRPPSLKALEDQVARDLELLGLPPRNWPVARSGPDRRPMPDVVIVGAGMCGIAAAIALKLNGVQNVRILDRSPAGQEGPWITYARMDTLRSPKHLPGPAMGVPSLTFRAWYEAQHGRAAWEALYKIPRGMWMDYLTWIRRAMGLLVENGVDVEVIEPAAEALRLKLRTASGLSQIHARRVVLATGRSGAGGINVPHFVDNKLWPDLAAHAAEDIDFARLRGKSVAVIGAGASAWDNAATALEAGAAKVDMYVRRASLPQVNKSKGAVYPGLQHGLGALGDAERWKVLVYLHDEAAPPPHETVLRTLAAGLIEVHFAASIAEVVRAGDRVRIHLTGPTEPAEADFLILGTGFQIDLARRAELRALLPHIATWADRYRPSPELARPELGRYPYLGPGFELLERVPATCPAVERAHLFNVGAMASHGALTGDIPGVTVGAERLALAITEQLFAEDFDILFASLRAFAEPELQGTPFLREDAPI